MNDGVAAADDCVCSVGSGELVTIVVVDVVCECGSDGKPSSLSINMMC